MGHSEPMVAARYEEATETIRAIPQNWCLVHWIDETWKLEPRYDMDAATEPYREMVKAVVESRSAWCCPGAMANAITQRLHTGAS